MTDRQYGKWRVEQGLPRWKLSEVLRDCLEFLVEFFERKIPDRVFPRVRVSPAARAPIIVQSDAMWNPVVGSDLGMGRLAFIVWVPS